MPRPTDRLFQRVGIGALRLAFGRLVVVATLISGCAYPAPPLGPPIAAEAFAMKGCRYIATVSENADPGQVLPWGAAKRRVAAVHRRARSLGATHLVWLYRNDTGASAEAYRCP